MDLIFCDICVDAKNSVENLPKLGTVDHGRLFLPLPVITAFRRALRAAMTTKMSLTSDPALRRGDVHPLEFEGDRAPTELSPERAEIFVFDSTCALSEPARC